MSYLSALFFFVTAPSPSEIYTLSLHDALPISLGCRAAAAFVLGQARQDQRALDTLGGAPHRFGERHRLGRTFARAADARRQIGGAHDRTVGEDHRAPQRVLELAHVAGPVVGEQ